MSVMVHQKGGWDGINLLHDNVRDKHCVMTGLGDKLSLSEMDQVSCKREPAFLHFSSLYFYSNGQTKFHIDTKAKKTKGRKGF